MNKTVLLCGHNSYAAQGLADALRAVGHTVIEFDNGETARDGDRVYGPAMQIEKNPHLERAFDVMINYILLKDMDVEENIEYVRAVLRFCRRSGISHLIHVSSVSVFKASQRLIHELSRVETNPNKLGPYAALKLSTENDIVEMLPDGLNLSLLRPGFILGEGLKDPIVAAGFRVPMNSLLVFGNASSCIPLISRDLLNRAIVKLVDDPPRGAERLLLADRHSPTKHDYLSACNKLLGIGQRVFSLPRSMWITAGLAGEITSRVLGKKDKKVAAKIWEVLFSKTFDPSHTENRLGFRFDLDWESLLERSFKRAMD